MIRIQYKYKVKWVKAQFIIREIKDTKMALFSPGLFFKTVMFFLLGQLLISAQSAEFSQKALPGLETGLPFIRNFRPRDYQGLPQNWAIAQDARGVMYFGNNAGVLEYDADTWRTIALPGLSVVHSLAVDRHGRIYVGGNNELGYLAPNTRGQLCYCSLLQHLPESERKFGRVTHIEAAPEGVYFKTEKALIRLCQAVDSSNNSTAWTNTIWKFSASSFQLHYIQHQILVSLPGRLLKLQGDSLQVILQHAKTIPSLIKLILPYPKETMSGGEKKSFLIGTGKEGLFLYDGSTLNSFNSDANIYLRENILYNGVLLPHGRYAFATLWGGVVIIDSQGQLLQIINKAAGLHNENILAVFTDNEGDLWLGTDGGIARIEISTPFTFFQERQGLKGQIYRVIKHKDRIYVGTSSGLAYLAQSPIPGMSPVFKFVQGMKAQTLALQSDGQSLLVGGNEGIYRYEDDGHVFLLDKSSAENFFPSSKYAGRIYVGLLNGFAVLKRTEGKYQLLRFPGIIGDVRFIAEDSNGAVWVSEGPQGIYYVQLPDTELTSATLANASIKHFGPVNGLPEGWVMPYLIGNHITFATPKGLKHFDPETGTFPSDSSLGVFFADTSRAIYTMAEDTYGQIWMGHNYKGRDEIGLAIPGKNGSYTWTTSLLSRLDELGYTDIIYADPGQPDIIWFGCEESLVRFNASILRPKVVDFPLLVRQVKVKGDSLLYGGAALIDSTRSDIGEIASPFLTYAQNALRFEYAAPTFDYPAANRYQYYLEGFDENWSAWTSETKKEYTNLHEGDYCFRVHAKNVYGQMSKEGIYAFTILPPWYRSWWSYLIYLLLGTGGVLGLIHLRLHALRQKSRQLEIAVAESTAQIMNQKNRLEEQAYQLREMDRVKSRFFANISHELRTPLTLILGPVEQMMTEIKDKKYQQELKIIHGNAHNLLRSVNQLLDLTRLEHGKLTLNVSAGDLVSFLKNLVISFSSLAEQRDMVLHFHSNVNTLPVSFDHDAIQKIFYNLLSNAFKFTTDGGKIELNIATIQKQEMDEYWRISRSVLSDPSYEIVLITVRDNGIGISPEKLPYVFDRFYQAESDGNRKFEGTGIGLSLAKELVELHLGSLNINSTVGVGTEVLVCLPLSVPEDLGKSSNYDNKIVETCSPGIEDHLSGPVDQETSKTVNGNSKTPLVLVIDDHSEMRKYLRSCLEGRYRVIEADDGESGLEMAREKIPDLVVSDVMMPGKDGFQLCAELKSDEKTCHLPVILLTARAGEENRLQGLETGADVYLTKPFNARELLVQAANLINLRQKLREKFSIESFLQSGHLADNNIDEAFLQRVTQVVEKNISDAGFNVENLAQQLRMSKTQLYRKLLALTNQSASHFIRSVRLHHARKLLRQDGSLINEVAFLVGFNSHAYFSKCFRDQFGYTPTEFTKKL